MVNILYTYQAMTPLVQTTDRILATGEEALKNPLVQAGKTKLLTIQVGVTVF